MKNILLFMAAAFCLSTASCNKGTEHSPPVVTTIQHSTAKGLQDHTATIIEANQWVTDYNDAHIGDTANKTLIVEKEFFAKIAADPDVSFITMRLALYEGNNTLVVTGWDSTGQNVVSEDQHIGIACAQCKCCVTIAINPDGTITQ